MITFLRKIRKSLLEPGTDSKPGSTAQRNRLLSVRVGRYLLYAIGEIALVVIGILIALQINNWNEARKVKQQEEEFFIKTLADLQNDSIAISRALTDIKKHQKLNYHL
jgi:hypothetical protein